MNDRNFRNTLIELLRGGQAHLSVEKAIEGISLNHITLRPSNMQHCVWETLEHIRIAQQDILRYTLDPNWQSPPFPQGYWPSNIEPTENAWNDCISGFLADFHEVIKLVEDTSLDLTSEIPHGEGRTYLRQILLVADHNSYHTSEIVQIRKALRIWQ